MLRILSTFLLLLLCTMSFSQSMRRKAEALYEKRDLTGAIRILDKAIEQGMTDGGFVYFDRANYKFESEDFEGAIADYSKAIETLDQYTNWIAVMRRGQSKHALKDYAGAIADYSTIITPKSGISDVLYHRAMAKIGSDDTEGACEDLNRAKDLRNYMLERGLALKAYNENCMK